MWSVFCSFNSQVHWNFYSCQILQGGIMVATDNCSSSTGHPSTHVLWGRSNTGLAEDLCATSKTLPQLHFIRVKWRFSNPAAVSWKVFILWDNMNRKKAPPLKSQKHYLKTNTLYPLLPEMLRNKKISSMWCLRKCYGDVTSVYLMLCPCCSSMLHGICWVFLNPRSCRC